MSPGEGTGFSHKSTSQRLLTFSFSFSLIFLNIFFLRIRFAYASHLDIFYHVLYIFWKYTDCYPLKWFYRTTISLSKKGPNFHNWCHMVLLLSTNSMVQWYHPPLSRHHRPQCSSTTRLPRWELLTTLSLKREHHAGLGACRVGGSAVRAWLYSCTGQNSSSALTFS